MHKKNPLSIPAVTPQIPASGMIRAWVEINHLKQLYRQGWLNHGIPVERCESVAEHSFMVAILSWFAAETAFPELDSSQLLRLALIHDFGEIYAGDLTPADHVSSEEKYRREQASLAQVCAGLPNGHEILTLWEEYSAGESPEARLVHQIDRLEMGLQAAIYQKQGLGNMNEFFQSTIEALEEPVLLSWFADLRSMLLDEKPPV